MNDLPRKKSGNGNGLVPPRMKRPLMISLGAHAVALLLVIVGLPHFKKDLVLAEPVPVEMITNVSELTTTNKPPVKAPPKEEKKAEEPPKPIKETPPPQPEPPKPDESRLKEPPKPEKSVEEILDELALEKKPEPKKEEKKPKEKPQKKKEEKKKKDEERKQDFDNLLKNLTPEEDPPQPETEPKKEETGDPSPAPNVSRFSDVLSLSEQDALRQQLSGCWNIMAGSANAEDMAVEIRVSVNPDRTVQSAKVVDAGRYNSDTFFRVAADSALRAVRNPRCTPLNLPPEKYEQWRDMTIVFDPKDMF